LEDSDEKNDGQEKKKKKKVDKLRLEQLLMKQAGK